MKLEILYEDAYLLACVKPYGVLSQGDKGNDEDMITKIKHYLYDQEESEQARAVCSCDSPAGSSRRGCDGICKNSRGSSKAFGHAAGW